MNLPGFAAESSLYGSRTGYSADVSRRIDQNIYPADYEDHACLDGCLQNCGSACAGTSGQGKSACIRQCAQENRDCHAACRWPGNPPTPPLVSPPPPQSPPTQSPSPVRRGTGSTCPSHLLRTDTACPLGGVVGLWCRDFCQRDAISFWYPCGVCVGGDL